MIISSQSEFSTFAQGALAEGYTHVPILRETLADLDTPVSTYLKLANQPYSYLFESVQGGDKWGRYSIIGLACDEVYLFEGRDFKHIKGGQEISTTIVDNPLDTIRELHAQYSVATFEGLPEMLGGLVGYFGYEIVALIEQRLDLPSLQDPIGTPDIMLMLSKDVLVFDNLAGRIFMVTLAELDNDQAYEQAQERLNANIAKLNKQLSRPADELDSGGASPSDTMPHFPQSDFEHAVERCREYIREGDIMQVVLSQRLSTAFERASFDLYRALRTINPSPYMYFLDLGDFQIVGSSPEILVRLEAGKVTVRPIAGTRKRGTTRQQDADLEAELLADEKELAEHLMLIDLGRNDVGRIAKTGSVELTEKMLIERYSHVMHIVSNVEGELVKEMDAIDVLKATFPAGTVSGAPKIRAMEIIHELEPIKRGIYSGAIGYLGWNGNMDTAIAIRTAVVKDGQLHIQAGAGIVADSKPDMEWQETLNKARAMITAVDMANARLGLDNERGGK